MTDKDYTNQNNSANEIADELFGSVSPCPSCRAERMSISCFEDACGCPKLDPRLGLEQPDCSGGGFLCKNFDCRFFEPFGSCDTLRQRRFFWLESEIENLSWVLERKGRRALSCTEESLLREWGLRILQVDTLLGLDVDIDESCSRRVRSSTGGSATTGSPTP